MVVQASRRSFMGGMTATATAAALLPVAAIARDADGGSEGLAYRTASDLVKAIAGRQVSSCVQTRVVPDRLSHPSSASLRLCSSHAEISKRI